MQNRRLHRFTRKAHRYLGLLLGFQLLAWTLGGMYFSWTKIEHIRSEDIRAEKKAMPLNQSIGNIGSVVDSLKVASPKLAVQAIQLVEILNKPFYQIKSNVGILLYDGYSLAYKAPLTKEESIQVALSSLISPAEVLEVEYLTSTSGHHEYREKPLPAYAIKIGDPFQVTVYVSTELGTVQSYRNNAWRAFDFLWMLHTMDFWGRDNFNNWLLRAFSIFSLITLLSGFLLYFLSSKPLKK